MTRARTIAAATLVASLAGVSVFAQQPLRHIRLSQLRFQRRDFRFNLLLALRNID